MSEWRTHQDELSRKVTEQLAHYIYLHEQEEITDEQLKVVCDFTYNCITGLVPWEIADLFKKASDELGAKKQREYETSLECMGWNNP